MRRLSTLLALCLITVSAWAAAPTGPAVGDKAPDFKLQDQKGEWHTLDTEKGKWLVVYFYPKDFTGGCTTEVCTFRDDIVKLHKVGAVVYGVSLDNVKSHAEFAAKYHVPFPLLSDADGAMATKYDVLSDEKGSKYARRETFLIDPNGKIAKVYKDVDPEKNSGQVLADLEQLKGSGV